MARGLMAKRRRELKLSQVEVAKRLGVSRSCYASYEQGAREPSVSMAMRLKEILKVNDDGVFINFAE